MLIINTGKRYRDLDLKSASLGLFETNCSPADIADKLDILLEDNSLQREITTLNESVINRIGYLIEEGCINHNCVQIKIFDNGSCTTTVGYTEEGYLDDNWILGLYDQTE